MQSSLNDLNETVKQNKWLRNLEDDMKLIIPYIDDRNVTDIAIGHGGELIVEGIGMDKNYTGIFFDEATTTRIIYASAAVMGLTIDSKNPMSSHVASKLPVYHGSATSRLMFANSSMRRYDFYKTAE